MPPLNVRDINIALNKAGITAETIDNFTMEEIAEVLGADYILMGSVDRSFEGTTALETGFGSINQKDWNKTNVYGGFDEFYYKKISCFSLYKHF